MTTQVYRFYRDDVQEDWNYLFSIVASEDEVQYVVPSNAIELKSVFNQERIDSLTQQAETLPDTPEGWALLAAYNTGQSMALFPVVGETGEDFDILLKDEKEYSEIVFEKYSYMREE